MALSRRDMLAVSGLGLVGVGLAGAFTGCANNSAPSPSSTSTAAAGGGGARGGWGPLTEAGQELALPRGFTYRTFGAAGTPMSDGLPTPGCHDGQALFDGGNGRLRLLRNHEIDLDIPGATQRAIAPRRAYDRAAPAGVTSSLYDPRSGQLVESFLVLNGTLSNCSGAPTPWGSWLTCEETTDGVGAGYEQPHGYVFEIPATATGLIEPVPLKAMGRFEHETAPVDPDTGIVYMTEDNNDPGDGFYRFVPNQPGKLAAGGRLQMLAVTGDKEYDTATGQRVGEVMDVHWVDIDEPDPSDAEDNPAAVYAQGRAKGGARFYALEGSAWSDGGVTFVASEAGDAANGQVWRYEPTGADTGTLRLLYESTDPQTLNQPDSVTVSPTGAVFMAEDGDGEDEDGGDNWLRVLTPSGTVADLARVIEPLDLHTWNAEDFPEPGATGASEMAGPAFTTDGNLLFVNVQYPGVTTVITGPWTLPS
ncbi:alkaline phosphatase PhoX [Mycolicibacterium palauense]|uniref:alkaline phosphatase PhoX n=1 Tax=Mycolicibacterium palauense TaxID=2034511 RepID=UPI001C3F26CF|nr:alkaline phosphatase PhoX [Mycolicibacterium palauense]